MIRTRLSVMMFLEFFIWGAWLPLIFGYLPSLGFSPLQQSWILNAFALASFVGMFFSNQFADRNFAAEQFLAFSHLIGGLAILGLFFVRPGWSIGLGEYQLNLTFWPFFLLMLVHCLFYVPTISITNSIAFANVKDPQRDFAAGAPVGHDRLDRGELALRVHPRRLGRRRCQVGRHAGSGGLRRLARRGAGDAEDWAGVSIRRALDVRRRRRRFAPARRLQPDAAAHAAAAGQGGRKPVRLARSGQAAWPSRSCSCSSS